MRAQMIIESRRLSVALLLTVAAGLSSCALMGGGGKPATLYQFGDEDLAPRAQQAPSVERPVVILYVGSSFERQSQGDRILTVTGNEVAYVAEARWVAPAQEMFDSAAIRHLEGGPSPLRVVRRGASPKPDYVLAIAVNRFQADYSSAGAIPEVIIEGRTKLMRVADRQIVGDWPFTAREPAQANRVSEIVAAFDRATGIVTGQVANQTFQALQGR